MEEPIGGLPNWMHTHARTGNERDRSTYLVVDLASATGNFMRSSSELLRGGASSGRSHPSFSIG